MLNTILPKIHNSLQQQTMRLLALVGKLLIISSILFQAFLLYHDKLEADQFNKNLNSTISQCSYLASLKQPLQEYLRLATSGLLASSLLMLFCRAWPVKLPTLLGLFVLLWVEHHGLCKQLSSFRFSFKLLDNFSLWHSLGVIGAVVYLMGAEWDKCRDQNYWPCESQAKAPEGSPEEAGAEVRGKPKRS